MSMRSFREKLDEHHPLARLIQPENFVGWIYRIDFEHAEVMTNDKWKEDANGIPHNCFLLAASFDPNSFAATAQVEREIYLLRVIGTARLPHDDDLVRTKIDYYQRHLSPQDSGQRPLDDLTQHQIQFGGLHCRILGTFYSSPDGELQMGSDLESFATAARLNVFRPRGQALNTIINYIDPMRMAAAREDAQRLGLGRALEPFTIGTVRYTSTTRLHRQEEQLVPMQIQPSDLLARRTGVLGMTRTGKSNMIKQLVAIVKGVADQSDETIGQIIYDLNGEYANANEQDRGSLADVFPAQTVRYRMIPTEGFRPLLNNFYEQLQEGFAMIRREIEQGSSSNANYVRAFLNLSLDEPDRATMRGEHARWERKIAAYKALLCVAGFEVPAGHRVYFSANASVREALAAQSARWEGVDPRRGLSVEDAAQWFRDLWEVNRDQELRSSSSNKPWVGTSLQILLNMIQQRNAETNGFISGHQLLSDAKKYHWADRDEEVTREIYRELVDGNIVVLDLSVGDPTTRERISKDVAQRIFQTSMKYFIQGRPAPNIVVYIEEAHNLIGRGMDLTDTWPRLAKEGAKYHIGLVYATQEISSMHPNILANTENWFITHLNNEREIKELSHFYDFGDFALSLLRAQDVGFCRVKTLSSPFVVPVQIDKFDPEALQEQS